RWAMSWYRTAAGFVRFPYISGLAASPRIGRTFGRASDTFRRSRKARGEISIAVIVACRQMSERWLTVVPFPPPRYKTDVASPYGQTRPPHFRYAASLLRFASHRRYSMPPSRGRLSPYTEVPDTRFRVSSQGPSVATPSHSVGWIGIVGPIERLVMRLPRSRDPRVYEGGASIDGVVFRRTVRVAFFGDFAVPLRGLRRDLVRTPRRLRPATASGSFARSFRT